MIGAKKLTRNTCRQTSTVVSSEPSRLPPSAFGEIAALLTSACSWPSGSRRLISAIAATVLASSREIDLNVVFRAQLPTGSFPGTRCREQVMTRQPAAEKRFTVAWPMPRLAPVSSSVRRGSLAFEVTIREP